MATKKPDRIHVNGMFGDEVANLQEALEQLEQQYQMERRAIVASIQTTVRLAGKSEGIPDGWQFDIETMEFYEPVKPDAEVSENGN